MMKFLKQLLSGPEPTEDADPALHQSGLSPQVAGIFSITTFNEKFVAANRALARGNTEGLKEGITLLLESLPSAGRYIPEVVNGVSELRCALSHHDRADTKGPWNRDFSGYGVLSWKNDLYDRDQALQNAWLHLGPINEKLRAQGLGWDYQS